MAICSVVRNSSNQSPPSRVKVKYETIEMIKWNFSSNFTGSCTNVMFTRDSIFLDLVKKTFRNVYFCIQNHAFMSKNVNSSLNLKIVP